ncbi:MAG: glycosyltransferase [Acidimicrobiia bacterium]
MTVVIATYNRAKYLPGAIDSVLEQGIPVRILVCDDHSSDDTPDVIAQYHDPCITYRRNPRNYGWLGNCNLGLTSADTEFALVLGDDDTMAPGALHRAVAALDAHPTAGMVHASMNLMDEDGRIRVERVDWTHDLVGDTLESGPDFIRKTIRHGCRVCSPTVLMRTKALPEIPYDPADQPASDVSLWLRIALDWDLCFLDTPAVNYRVHSGSDSATWSTPTSSGYVDSARLIVRIWAMKTRFIRKHRDRLLHPGRLRFLADWMMVRRFVSRLLGPRVVGWYKTQQARLSRTGRIRTGSQAA